MSGWATRAATARCSCTLERLPRAATPPTSHQQKINQRPRSRLFVKAQWTKHHSLYLILYIFAAVPTCHGLPGRSVHMADKQEEHNKIPCSTARWPCNALAFRPSSTGAQHCSAAHHC